MFSAINQIAPTWWVRPDKGEVRVSASC